ncbi:MAG: tetratricopeptide repeat protein, partial [Cyclobacteriaceae bacterium]|nr:tetratricopeptide repeat protein [Cyclobacteriaceae bacterium]
AWSYLLNGQLQPAYDSWAGMAELEQNYHPSQRIFYRHRLAYVLWQLDQKEEARKIFEEQRVLLRKNIESDQITNTAGEYYDLAGINAFLGNEKLALNWLEQASEEGFFDLELINIDPLFDNIRDHEQYQAMIQSRQAKWERQNRRMDTGREVVRQKLHSLEDKVPMV